MGRRVGEWMREGGEWMRKEEVFYVGWEGEVGSGKG